MIYCIGERAKYDAKLASGEPLYKLGRGFRDGGYYEGGSVWRTEDDARAFIARSKIEKSHAVYGVVAEWDADTVQAAREPYRRLVRSAEVVRLAPPQPPPGGVVAPEEAAGPERAGTSGGGRRA